MNYLGFEKERVSDTAKALNTLLAEYHVYYQNLRNFHWNVRGENFFELHQQFEALYQAARSTIDDLAERILTLHHRPLSQMSDYISVADIAEAGSAKDDREMVGIVLKNHTTLILQLRKAIKLADEAGDEGTVDLLSGVLGFIEKRSWMLDTWMARSLEAVMA